VLTVANHPQVMDSTSPTLNHAVISKKKKKKGGQAGHAGKTLKRSDTPDVIVNHDPECCQSCQHTLNEEERLAGNESRQVYVYLRWM